ncbi:REST corepressor isoform X2 [Contarinia nasturtii]|uniref:REST corepressor isoform X2 n=1 Tax=Contarinia nasturtii TaxID=265458 RepID=UPI0012D4A94D|nr:REST corepressor isoform X2 [Contarinia nasturtii]
MVHVDRYQPENLRNGRSRGPSPNGHNGSPDTSDDDSTKNAKGNKSGKSKSEYEEKIRVGKDYQTTCPDFIPPQDRKLESLNDRALLVWSPTKDIPDNKLEDYISVAKERFGYNGEQALGMLFWHKHDLERAVLDLANFTPFPDEWTEEDKVLFEQAFQFHGKSFHRIRQMLPDKSIASLVKYYYSWKKTRSRTSVMDRQEKMKAKEGSENGSENGSNDDSDNEDKASPNLNGGSSSNGSNQLNIGVGGISNNKETTSNFIGESSSNAANLQNTAGSSLTANNNPNTSTNDKDNLKSSINASADVFGNVGQNQKDCVGCGVPCNHTNTSSHGALCKSCFHHWSRTGSLRPTSGPGLSKRSRNNTNNGVERHKSKLPRGMYINHDDIVKLASQESSNSRGDDLLTNMDREISTLLSQIQNNKQMSSSLKVKNSNKAASVFRPGTITANRISARWSNDEYQLAIQGMRIFGKDFQSIAEIIGTKTESQVNQFYTNYRKKYSLDDILKEYETKKLQEQQQKQKLNEAKQKASRSNSTNSNDIKFDLKKPVSNDEIMEIDLVDDIPNKDDEDMDEVTIIETDSMPSTTQKSTNFEQLLSGEPMDSISITAISSSSGQNGSTHQSEPIPEVTISPAGSNSTITSTTSLMAIVEQSKAAAV